jgi:hypothetical protein
MRDRESSAVEQESSDYEKSVVLSALEHDQLVKARKRFFPRRQLKGAEFGILWALRIYVILMMFVVAYQVWIAAR